MILYFHILDDIHILKINFQIFVNFDRIKGFEGGNSLISAESALLKESFAFLHETAYKVACYTAGSMIAYFDIAVDNAGRVAEGREYVFPLLRAVALYTEEGVFQLLVGLGFAVYREKRVYGSALCAEV